MNPSAAIFPYSNAQHDSISSKVINFSSGSLHHPVCSSDRWFSRTQSIYIHAHNFSLWNLKPRLPHPPTSMGKIALQETRTRVTNQQPVQQRSAYPIECNSITLSMLILPCRRLPGSACPWLCSNKHAGAWGFDFKIYINALRVLLDRIMRIRFEHRPSSLTRVIKRLTDVFLLYQWHNVYMNCTDT